MEAKDNHSAIGTVADLGLAIGDYVWTFCKYGGPGLVAGMTEETGHKGYPYAAVFAPGALNAVGAFLSSYFAKEIFNYKRKMAKNKEEKIDFLVKRAAIAMTAGRSLDTLFKEAKEKSGEFAAKATLVPTLCNAAGYLVGRLAGKVIN